MSKWQRIMDEHKPEELKEKNNWSNTDKKDDQERTRKQLKAKMIRQHLKINEHTNTEWLAEKIDTTKAYIRNIKYRMKKR